MPIVELFLVTDIVRLGEHVLLSVSLGSRHFVMTLEDFPLPAWDIKRFEEYVCHT